MGRGNRFEPTGEGTVNVSPDEQICGRAETNGWDCNFADSFTASCTAWENQFQCHIVRPNPPEKDRTCSSAPDEDVSVLTC